MKVRGSLGCFAAAASMAVAAAHAQQFRAGEPAPAGECAAPRHDGHPLAGRQERISQYEGLGEQCLKQLVLRCDVAAARQLLDPGSAADCSFGYEALLKRAFGGDFQAMLDWWRTRPADPPQ